MDDCIESGQRGRRRKFDLDAALHSALEVFWTKGFEGASVNELAEAVGVSKPSLYLAFGNKDALFRKVLTLYRNQETPFVREALAMPTAKEVASAILAGALETYTGRGERGCLVIGDTLARGDDAREIRAEVKAYMLASQSDLADRFEQARKQGDLPLDADAVGLASYLFAALQGLAVQAAAGVERSVLEKMIAVVLRAF